MAKLENLTGKTFGYLEVIEYAGIKPSGRQQQSCWLCRCICGKQIVVFNNNLKRGNSRSCGCRRSELLREANLDDLTSQKFGMLQPIKYVETRNSNAYWLCRCDCGKETISAACALKSGDTKSCGCKQGWWRSTMPGLWKNSSAYAKWKREDPLINLRHQVSCSIRSMLKHNGSYKRKKSIRNYLPYTIEELKAHLESRFEPWMNWENYGGKSNNPERTWHIDHINAHSNFPYTSMEDDFFKECWALSNLRPLEKKANMSKGAKSVKHI